LQKSSKQGYQILIRLRRFYEIQIQLQSIKKLIGEAAGFKSKSMFISDIYAVLNKSRIVCFTLVPDLERIRIENLQARIGSGFKKDQSLHTFSAVLFNLFCCSAPLDILSNSP